MKQLNLYYLGGGGGGSVPDGKTVTPINDVTIWQQCAGISNPTYTTLAEILADTGILQTLMSSNNAVDYLARSKAFIEKIPLVPQMTGYTSPSGEVDCSGVDAVYTTYYGWKAFDRDESTVWWSNSASNAWVQFTFDAPTKVNKISVKSVNDGVIRLRNFKIQGSNDKFVSDTHDLYTGVYANSATLQDFDFSNDTPYETYRLLALDNYGSGNLVVAELQFYYGDGICQSSDAMYYVGQNNYCADTLLADATWRSAICGSTYKESVLNVKNPDMTSNTAPSGRCYGSSLYSGARQYYYGFDNNNSTQWYSQNGSQVGQYLAYEFATPARIVMFDMYVRSQGNASGFKIQKSEDDVTWSDVTDVYSVSTGGFRQIVGNFANTSAVKYWRIYVTAGTANSSADGFMPAECKFYGREDV